MADILHNGGLGAGVLATIVDREKKIRGAMFEAIGIIQDYRSQYIGGFMTALDLWKMALLPSLMYGAGTWVGITEEAVQRLENIQLTYLRMALQVGPGVTKVALRSETGLGSMHHLIWREKIMTIHHIRSLDMSSLARRIWEEQEQNFWPGLAMEVRDICVDLNIPDINKYEMTKAELKRVVEEACRIKDGGYIKT